MLRTVHMRPLPVLLLLIPVCQQLAVTARLRMRSDPIRAIWPRLSAACVGRPSSLGLEIWIRM